MSHRVNNSNSGHKVHESHADAAKSTDKSAQAHKSKTHHHGHAKQDAMANNAPESASSPKPNTTGLDTDTSASGRSQAVGVPVTSVSRTVNVSSTAELKAALANAQSGDKIQLSPGTYDGPLTLSGKSGVTISGSPQAIIAGKNQKKPAFEMDDCKGCTLTGFAISGGQKGLMVKQSSNNVFDNLDVGSTQMEAVHLKNDSSDNVIQGCKIHDTGLGGDTPAGNNRTQADDGEGIYIGTAKSNSQSPDRSDRNKIIGNTIYNTTAENIDIKENTSGGTIQGNSLDGSQCKKPGATSVVEIKGSGYNVTGNTVQHAGSLQAFRNYQVKGVDGSGTNNTIDNNQTV